MGAVNLSAFFIAAGVTVLVFALVVACLIVNHRHSKRDDLMDLADVLREDIARDEIAELDAMFNAPAYEREERK